MRHIILYYIHTKMIQKNNGKKINQKLLKRNFEKRISALVVA